MAAPGGMQLLGLSVTGPREGAEDVVLASAMDLSQFSFFQRGTCVCERRPREQRLSASRRSLASDRRCCAPAACSMADLLKFFFRTFTKRTDPGTVRARTATPGALASCFTAGCSQTHLPPPLRPVQRSSIAHEGYMCHVYVRADGLGATAVVNNDYPDRVAFTLLNTILDEFVSVHGDKWQGQTSDDCLPLCVLSPSRGPRPAVRPRRAARAAR